MGWLGSSEEKTEQKTVDTTGQVNNNIVIQEAEDIHQQVAMSEKLLFATYLLVGAEIIKLCVYLFVALKKHFKKRYQTK